MLYNISYDITIGAYRVQTLVSVSIHRSVEELIDTAQIVLPGTLLNAAIEVEDKIQVGDAVEIRLGYQETGVETEFKGYLKSIQTDGADIVLECEDEMWVLRRTALKDEQIHGISLKGLLQKITTGTGLQVECDYDFTYKEFVFNNATAHTVLKKMQEETKADIYIEDGTLHLHPVYSKTGERVIYDMALNVESSDLKYKKADDEDIEVVVSYTDSKGNVYKGTKGTTGGRKIERTVSADSAQDAQRVAENEYNALCYDGYEGGLTGWLVPYCKPTDIVEIRDSQYEQKTGRYYVVATEVTLGSTGGRRKVVLGRRIS